MKVKTLSNSLKGVPQHGSVIMRFRRGNEGVFVETRKLEGWVMGQFFKWSAITTGIVAGGALIGKLLNPIFNKTIDSLYEIDKALKQS